MEFLNSNEARRLRNIAILKILPIMSQLQIVQNFNFVIRQVNSAVQSFIYELTNQGSPEFYSPENIKGYETISRV